eukprot:TRINITY_DN56277_c0_g1_i1.p1 TRINITY_DN56277_c0_g1~~TRINITY_DN56277_c0_g1_i1.p1  ORF type:complete len:255 (+),score=92.42 TRINITY_DN56277_c0_g1_i1:68-766(+)
MLRSLVGSEMCIRDRHEDTIQAQETQLRMATAASGSELQGQMAVETITNLQARLSKKDKSMQAMRERIDSLDEDLINQKSIYEQQLLDLTNRLNEVDNANLKKLTKKLHKLDQADISDEVIELTELGKQEIAARDTVIARLTNDVEKLEDENKQFAQLVSDKNDEINTLMWEVSTLKERSVQAPASSADSGNKINTHRNPTEARKAAELKKANTSLLPVSYTHLTLPTKRIV